VADLDSTGLTVSTQAEILAGIEADERAEIGTGLDLSTSSPLGQLNRLIARAIRLQEEGLAAVYNAIDPDAAAGDSLFRLGALTGTVREAATYSRAVLTVDLDADTYAIGALVFYPAGRPEDLFANVEEIVAAGGAENVLFQAETAGPVEHPGTPTAVPVSGWNSIDALVSFSAGSAIETEAAFRARRNAEVESPGSSSPSGIVADLTREIPEIESCFCVENDTDATVDSIPPHAIEVVVFGPESATDADNDAVAEQILASKAAGIGTYGTTTRTVYDSEDQPHAISFTRPADVSIEPTLTLAVSATEYAGDDEVISHILERAAETYVPGLNASWSQFVTWAMEVAGVLRVSAVDIGAGAFTDIAITSRQIATVIEADITITSAEATP
jgi:uncharacterized phage protein gp47/JayE